MPVGSLLVFGGETLKDFAFALLVGVASGAYSSIFIATPVLVEWKERETTYMRRRRLIMDQHGGLVLRQRCDRRARDGAGRSGRGRGERPSRRRSHAPRAGGTPGARTTFHGHRGPAAARANLACACGAAARR